MSARVRSNNSRRVMKENVVPARAPFCKHCANINTRNSDGMALNTDHWVSDCVVLKNTVCLNCNKKGHTVSRCNKPMKHLSPNTTTTIAVILNSQQKNMKTAVAIKRNVSRFSCLNELDEEEEEEEKVKDVCKTPTPRIVAVCPGAPNRASYADALKKAKEVANVIPFPEFDLSEVKTRLFRVKKHINWADYTDSDDEE